MKEKDLAGWDRDADLTKIRDTYGRYDRTDRSRLWDEDDPGYARLTSELQAHLLESLAASVSGTSTARVLDLGCGDGELAGDRARLGRPTDWIGLDLRPEVIEIARARFPDLTFLVGSADAVPLDDASLDVIVARVLFSSLPSAPLEVEVAREIARLLRPGGWLVWLDLRYPSPWNPAVHPLPRKHVAGLFPGWRLQLRSAGLIPPLARRLGRMTRTFYPPLAALPPLRSHLVGRLQRPQPGA